MRLTALTLEQFRRFEKLELLLPEEGLAIVGDNASGKSTILEAIDFLATTKSSRTTTEREVIGFESGVALGVTPFARIAGSTSSNESNHKITIAFEDDPARERALRKILTLDGQNRRAVDLVGTFTAVLFEPGDVAFFTGPPSIRRRYLDQLICQIDPVYMRSLSRFQRIIEQRNSLLKTLAKSGISTVTPRVVEQIGFWDNQLIALGARVIARRFRAVESLSGYSAERFHGFSDAGVFRLSMISTLGDLKELTGREESSIEELEAVVTRSYELAVRKSLEDDLRRGATTIGPHRDDLAGTLNDNPLASFGSRGQQRLGITAMRLAEADVIHEVTGEFPVMLLDDILSELDLGHRRALLEAIGALHAQVVITATDLEDLAGQRELLPDIARLHESQISPL